MIEVNDKNTAKVYTRAENGKLSKVIDYGNGNRVEIPINRDGSVKFYDDTKLIHK